MEPLSDRPISKLNNRTIIIFDNRGAGESTSGIKDFSISQFANDTVGLFDALHIKKQIFLAGKNFF
ncbi:MAG TPA: hypothetical protein VFX18_02950 [Candidatus Nitrosocosmicus sp.]|nr:hypothetical protein [Candidatus Nitrosocosmicus sp.]